MTHEEDDALLTALRALPPPGEGAPDQRHAVRAAFLATAAGESWLVRARRPAARLAVPLGLAAVVVLYLDWAVKAAALVMH